MGLPDLRIPIRLILRKLRGLQIPIQLILRKLRDLQIPTQLILSEGPVQAGVFAQLYMMVSFASGRVGRETCCSLAASQGLVQFMMRMRIATILFLNVVPSFL